MGNVDLIKQTSFLASPEQFAYWWEQRLSENQSSVQMADSLEAVGTPLSAVRAGLALGFAPENQNRVRFLAGLGISYGDETIRLFGLCVIAMLDVKIAYQLTRGELNKCENTLILLETLLDDCKNAKIRNPVLSEIEARLHRAIGEATLINGKYEQARRHFVLAIAFGQALKMDGFVFYSRLFLANTSLNSGAMAEADALYNQLISDFETPSEIVLDAQIYKAVTLFWCGEDTQMKRLLEVVLSQFPDQEYVQSYCYALKAMSGVSLMPVEISYRRFLPNGLATLSEAFGFFWQSFAERGEKRKKYLLLARQTLELMQPRSTLTVVMAEFLKGLIALRLQEFTLASKAIENALKIQTTSAMRVLVLGLTLELGLNWHGFEIIRMEELISEIRDTMALLSESAKSDIAQRFLLLFPYAGALCAVCPEPIDGLLVLSDAILDVSERPIRVFGTLGLRPIHAVRATLEAFAVKLHYSIDGGGQLNSEEQVLYRMVGTRKHWFEPVSPALLIYVLLHIHERVVGSSKLKSFSVWSNAALQVSRRFGILPQYIRGPFQREANNLQTAVECLLAGECTTTGFRRLVEN